MMYHLFHNYMWKVVRIAKTSDCKILVKTEVLSTVKFKNPDLNLKNLNYKLGHFLLFCI